MSAREVAIAAIVKALSGTAGVGSNIFRSRTDAIAADEMPALVVLPESDTPTENTNGPIDSRLQFVVEVYARADALADKAADPVCVSVHAKLMSDATLNGAIVDLSEVDTEWDYDQSDQSIVIARMRFSAWYRRNRNTLN